jgi:hypothetical protein
MNRENWTGIVHFSAMDRSTPNFGVEKCGKNSYIGPCGAVRPMTAASYVRLE